MSILFHHKRLLFHQKAGYHVANFIAESNTYPLCQQSMVTMNVGGDKSKT